MAYSVIKALHIIFMVSYFAGIFYLVRLFVYYKDTDDFDETRRNILREQYNFMAARLWNIITLPAGVLMLSFGIVMIVMNPGLLSAPWFHLKLTFLLALTAYHAWCWKMVRLIKNLNGENLPKDNLKLRMANEFATLILFAVVFTVILKNLALEHWWQLLLGFAGFVVLIMSTVQVVNRRKNKSNS